jgi:tetratricopeptide (TPR) repeat protein
VKIFISYSRIDAKETAKTIHSYLTEYGHHEVFIDTSNIPYGGDWNEVIQKEISNCDIFIIIITPSALYRSEVEKEVELAKSLKKKIIPCIAKDYVEEDEIKWELNRYQGFFYDRDSKLAMDLHMMIKRDTKIKKTSEIKAEIKTDKQHSPFTEKQNLAENTLQNEKNSAMDSLPKPSVLPPTDKNSNENFQEILKPTTDAKADTPIPIKPNIDEIKSNKEFLQIYLERAKSFEKTKQYQKALSEHEEVLKIDHDNLEALFSKVLILYRMEKFDESLQAIERVIDLQPEHPDIYYYKGIILEKMERHREALEALEASYLINKDTKSLSTKANVLSKLKRFKEALETYDEILRLDTSNLNALNGKGNILNDLERYKEALQHYDKALAIDPTNVQTLINKGIFFYNLIKDKYSNILSIEINPPDSSDISDISSEGRSSTSPPPLLDPYQQAIECFDKALKIDPGNVQALTYKGIVLNRIKNKREAKECFDKALKIDPGNVQALTYKGIVLKDEYSYSEAIECFDKALEIDPNYVDALYCKGKILGIHQGKLQEAIECFDKALKIDPTNTDIKDDKEYLLGQLSKQTKKRFFRFRK